MNNDRSDSAEYPQEGECGAAYARGYLAVLRDNGIPPHEDMDILAGVPACYRSPGFDRSALDVFLAFCPESK